MNPVRYWESQPTSVAVRQDREKKQAAQQFAESFQSSLWDKMAALGGSSLPGFADVPSMMADNPMANLMQVNVDGIEKVWAEQLKHPASFFNTGYSSEDHHGSVGGLSSAISMAAQIHMIKAKKQVQQNTTNYGLNAFMNDVGAGASVNAGLQELTTSVDEFVSNMQWQIKQASNQFGLSVDELKQRLGVA